MNKLYHIKGFPDYVINGLGEVYSLKSETIRKLKFNKDKDGYLLVHLYQNRKRYAKKVHRLVTELFIFNVGNKPQVNHIDGNKENNNIDNLEWCTPSENSKHSYHILGNKNTPRLLGENHQCAKLTNKQVVQLRRDLECAKYGDNIILAKKYNISIPLLQKIKAREVWKHV